MPISELARLNGVTTHALRHYERMGLLKPARHDNGYREYSEAMRREVIFIAMSRKIGFSLPAIAEQLPAYRAGRLQIADMVESLLGRVAEIDKELAELSTLRAQVLSHIDWLKRKQFEKASASKTSNPHHQRSMK
jgi:MerR family copper efflux transcriptional regulator